MRKFRKKNFSVPMWILMVILGIYTISVFVPLFWGLMTSFKTRTDFVDNPFGFPGQFIFGNYGVAIENFRYTLDGTTGKSVGIITMLLNTLLYSLGCAFFSTMSACIVAYATSRFNFFTSKIIYGIVIVTMALPIIGAAPSELFMVKTLHLYDSHIGMWIMKSNFLGLYYLIFFAMFKGIPKDYSEAAAIDGASQYRIFFTIMLPLVFKTFSTVYLLYFIGFWNDYQTPLLYMPSYPTLAMGLFSFTFSTDSKIGSVPIKMAGNFMIFVPILIVFIIFRNKLLGNISMGGVKE